MCFAAKVRQPSNGVSEPDTQSFARKSTTPRKVSGSIGRLGLQYVVAAEWLLGYYLLAAMIFTLAETMPLINRLLTGVF